MELFTYEACSIMEEYANLELNGSHIWNLSLSVPRTTRLLDLLNVKVYQTGGAGVGVVVVCVEEVGKTPPT